VEIFVYQDRVLVVRGSGPVRVLNPDGSVSEQHRVQGDLVWADGERGFDQGYTIGFREGENVGYNNGVKDAAEDAAKPTAVAS
jgi:hypothetical protein